LSFLDDKALSSNDFTPPSGKSIKVTVDRPKDEPSDKVTGDDRATARISFPERIEPTKKTLDVSITDLLNRYPDSSMKTGNEDSGRVKEDNKIVAGAYICSAQ
jgi:hypothetical protein